MSTWLYQYWLYCFKTAKSWGRGPKEWNVESLQFLNGLQAVSHIPRTDLTLPEFNVIITDSSQLEERVNASLGCPQRRLMPHALCRWSIHRNPEAVEAEFDNFTSEPPDLNPDPSDDTSWKSWPDSWKAPPLQERLLESLASNSFSNVKTEDLPIAVPQVIKASRRSNEQFLAEAWGFSIMARNQELVSSLGQQLSYKEFSRLYPLHLAASFLDGSRSCCNIIGEVLSTRTDLDLNINPAGHTVLDSLMIAILKSHTSMSAGAVDDSVGDEGRFLGEEVDICGRWDADSSCFRALVAAGQVSVPFEWKHKFCHTSAQTVCHFIAIIALEVSPQILFDPSGLFVRDCSVCELGMQLQPLHVVVLVTFHLAESGCEDEDLFGMLAVLLSMLFMGANPLSMASISIPQLFDREKLGVTNIMDLGDCDHMDLNPSQLADIISSRHVHRWSPSCRIGWNIIACILQMSTAE